MTDVFFCVCIPKYSNNVLHCTNTLPISSTVKESGSDLVNAHCVKSVKIRIFFWSEYWKIRSRKNSVFGYFPRSDDLKVILPTQLIRKYKLQLLKQIAICKKHANNFAISIYQIRRKLQICSHLLKKFLRQNFIFCAAIIVIIINKFKTYIDTALFFTSFLRKGES